MKNRFDTATVTMRILVVSLIFMVLLVFGFGISCQSQAPASAPPTPSPGLPKGPTSTEPPSTPPQIEVAVEGFAFKPAEITVPVGTTVIWYNNDSVIHTVTARDGSFDSDSLSEGDMFSYTFEERGTFEYYCIPHPYMEGQVVVE